ncbi:hypothetical protein BAC3_00880 [uncultured bacterium]|nr:hypothetical protein BAC3_00880 [uncultured bacterium]
MSKKFIHQITLCLLLNTIAANVLAFDWMSNNIQVLQGNTFQLGDKSRTTVTIEHSDGWQYGSNFFFLDIINQNNVGTELYAELYSYLSLNKLTGRDVSIGFIKDFSLMMGLNIGNKPEYDNFQAYLLGINFELNAPTFDYLQISVSSYKNDNIKGKYGVQITPVWSVPFEIADVKFKFRGFTDFTLGSSSNATNTFTILSQPQLLVDVGDLMGLPSDKLYIGTEYQHWHNKFGLKGVDEHVVQAMVIGFF